ncbi:MAG: hypothetical protein HKN12_04155 [Gemmatimonadetes bacterium]|nr:hypothetical protein [Gemmatimonadota bacterium]
MFPDVLWTSAGGDYVAGPSATQTVDQIGAYAWSGAGLAADVQAWSDGAAPNHGWILIGDETFWSAKRFGSRENANVAERPQITIDFTPPAAGCPGDANGDLVVDMDDIVAVMMDYGQPGPGANGGDVDMSGFVDIDDIVFVILNFGANCG